MKTLGSNQTLTHQASPEKKMGWPLTFEPFATDLDDAQDVLSLPAVRRLDQGGQVVKGQAKNYVSERERENKDINQGNTK